MYHLDHSTQLFDVPPWKVRQLPDYRVSVLEAPYLNATIGSSEVYSAGEDNLYSLLVVTRGAATFLAPNGRMITLFKGQTTTEWDNDVKLSLSNNGRYVCIFPLRSNKHNLKVACLTEPTLFDNVTILLIDGTITINGYVYSNIQQITVKESTLIHTEDAVIAWTSSLGDI